MAYEYFYPGTPYSLEPEYGELFTGYRVPLASIGMSTDPRVANQIQEISSKLSTGAKVMEISAVSPEIFDSIPKQQLTEVNRLSKLAGIETSIHLPLIEASGYTREGWSEANRSAAENQMKMAIDRSHDLNPNGNMPVTFHSTAMLPAAMETIKEKVGGEWKEVPKSMLIVEPRTGEIRPLKEMERFFPGEEKKFDPVKELERKNKDVWVESVGNINFYAVRGEELIEDVERFPMRVSQEFGAEKAEKIKKLSSKIFEEYGKAKEMPKEFEKLPEEDKEMLGNQFRKLEHANIYLRDAYRNMRELYNMAYKEADEKDRERLNEYARKIKESVESGKGIEREPTKLKEFARVIEEGVKVLNNINPKIFKPLNEFIVEKSAQTFGNVAFNAYQKFGDKAPIVSIENPPIGGGLARADELKTLIEESRKEFVKKAVKKGMGAGEAEDTAKKLIGATWDVGHINMLRKYGYDKADVVKETAKIAPFVKHVHLSDNFGMEHTELPMGMGNVPIKEIMEKLGKEGFEGRKIIEAAAWWQHMKTPPFAPALEALGSPVYGMTAAPYWNQINATYGNYFALPSAYLPEQHFSMYGGGFAALPTELGGQMPGKPKPMGSPME